MATPCYTVYIPVMKEYLKRANFLAFRILYRLSLATERERRLTYGAPKSNNWIDQWQRDNFDTGSQV